MITKDWLKNRDKRNKNRDGGKARLGERTYMYTCSTPQTICTGKFNTKIQAQGHGSPEDAMRCVRKAERRKEEEG